MKQNRVRGDTKARGSAAVQAGKKRVYGSGYVKVVRKFSGDGSEVT